MSFAKNNQFGLVLREKQHANCRGLFDLHREIDDEGTLLERPYSHIQLAGVRMDKLIAFHRAERFQHLRQLKDVQFARLPPRSYK